MATATGQDPLSRAAAALREGRPRAAVKACNKLLKQARHPDALHLKGLALHLLGEHRQAIAALEAAVAAAPGRAAYRGNLGRVWAALNEYGKAVECFDAALGLAPDAARDHEDRGTALCCLERLAEGALAFERAIALAPPNAPALLKLARARAHQGRFAEALDLAQRAMALTAPLRAKAQAIIGFVRLEQRDWPMAVQAFSAAIEVEPDNLEALTGRAKAWLRLKDGERALADARRAAATAPRDLEARLMLGEAEREFGDTGKAAGAFEQAAALRPEDVRARWQRANLLPAAYDSEQALLAAREAWRQRMTSLANDLRLATPEQVNGAVSAIKSANDFRLPYQGLDDRPLQEIYGGILHRVAVARYPEHARPPECPPRERPRVGFVSEFLRRHSIWKTHGAWITACAGPFEKYVYYTGADFDDGFTSAVQGAADCFVQETSVHRLIALVALHRPDVLIYLDHGMSVDLQLMAGLWLAPVQANGLGHPVTSGLPTMTHALSSTLMEPADGERHYTERLLRLPNTASCYGLARLRQDLAGLAPPERDGGRVEYLCVQNLQKYLPQYDHLFADIAQALPAARFHFIARPGEGREVFQRRLAGAFARRGLEAERFCAFHPGLGWQDFMRLNLGADVFLDGILWSGNNTAHEAVACGLPIVTWPGPFMRARHCLAILKMLGLTETIAESADDYVRLAVRLGEDKEWREHLRHETLARLSRLFDDPAPIRGLEAFLRSAMR